MSSLSDILSDYFGEESNSKFMSNKRSLINEIALPVSARDCSWEIHQSPERFSKTYRFSNKTQVADFISEIIRYEQDCNHSGTQSIDGLEVTVEVYTHDVNKITELDQEYSSQVDFIHRDVLDFAR